MNDEPANRTPASPGPDRQAERAKRRAARRAALGREIDTSVASPCISVCQIDNTTDRCLGCLRTIDEIRDWMIMTAEEKTAVLETIEQRKTRAVPDAGGR